MLNKNKLFAILRILTSLLLLFLLLWLTRKNFPKIAKLLSSVKISIFFASFLLFLISITFATWRLKIALLAQKANFTTKELLPLTFIGYFFSNFMPTSVGGDLVKGYYISKKIKTGLTSYTSVFFDRLTGLSSLAILASIALVMMKGNIEYKFIIWVIFLLLVCCIIFFAFLFNRKLIRKVATSLGVIYLLEALKLDALAKRFYQAINAYTNHKKKIFQMLIVSIFMQLINFFSVYTLSISLSIALPFSKIFLVMPVIAVLCMLPITINGLGLREWSFVLFFSSTVGDAAALSLSLLFLSIYLLTSLIGGISYLFWR